VASAASHIPLAAKLYLLSCHDRSGRTRISAARLELGLGGALLLELVRAGRVGLVDEHVVVVDRTPVGDPLLDHALAELVADPRPRDPDHWVRHLARHARAAVEKRLVTSGLLRVDDHRVLGLFPVHHAHQTDSSLEHELVERMNEAVVLGRPPDPETAALLSLAAAVGLERCLFPRSDRRAVLRRMEEIADGEWVGRAVHHAIEAQDAALGIEAGTGGAAP
jgi:Golgi phosphoprotein 3 GPP34